MNREFLLLTAINASIDAGNEILKIYHSDFTIQHKKDKTPVTNADKNAHACIQKALESTGLPILSEEGEIPSYSDRKNWSKFWMVDPLDGTKEFVNQNGEFTVNIALIENNEPSMGIIYIPVTQELYFSDKDTYKTENITSQVESLEGLVNISHLLPFNQKRTSFIVAASRSHINTETEEFINRLSENHKNIETLKKGSSLKLCLIAEGTIDIYPRFSPTMEWDIAAGHAIVKASGGIVINQETKKSLAYNKRNLKNVNFVAYPI